MRPFQIIYFYISNAYFSRLVFYLKLINFRGFCRRDTFCRFSRELNFADFADFWQFAKISSREILFPRELIPAKIKTLKVCMLQSEWKMYKIQFTLSDKNFRRTQFSAPNRNFGSFVRRFFFPKTTACLLVICLYNVILQCVTIFLMFSNDQVLKKKSST